jgi:hypothetical protein
MFHEAILRVFVGLVSSSSASSLFCSSSDPGLDRKKTQCSGSSCNRGLFWLMMNNFWLAFGFLLHCFRLQMLERTELFFAQSLVLKPTNHHMKKFAVNTLAAPWVEPCQSKTCIITALNRVQMLAIFFVFTSPSVHDLSTDLFSGYVTMVCFVCCQSHT